MPMTHRRSLPHSQLPVGPVAGPHPRLARARENYHAGRLDEAERDLRKLVKQAPKAPEGLHLLGIVLARRGATEEAEQLLRQTIKQAPAYPAAHANLANVLMDRGQPAAAEPCYAQAARLDPNHAGIHYNWGCCLRSLGRLSEAIAAYRQALFLRPDFIEPAVNLASALCESGDLEEAESIYMDLLARRPDLVDLKQALGQVCHLQRRFPQARRHFEELLRARPGHAGAQLGLAAVLMEENDLGRAQQFIAMAGASGGARKPDLLITLASLRARQGDHRAAISSLSLAIQSGANQPQHYLTLAECFAQIKEREKAVGILESSLAQFGERPPGLLPSLVVNQYAICDWNGAEARLQRVLQQIRDRAPLPIPPLAAMTLPGLSPEDLRHITRLYSQQYDVLASNQLAPLVPRDPRGDRPRIGYLSYDFHEHATAYLTAAVFEAHDRDQYEVFAYSYGPDDGSPTRRRLVAGFEHFVDIGSLTHVEAAQRIRADGIDILVDLKGYTAEARPEILALRPAPIQVSWLGYPGTMAVPFMDYMIVDEVVVPPAEAAAYEEALAYLPDAYAPVDPRRPVGVTPRREDVGLPSTGFVFCCFNNIRKITPEIFERWTRLLGAVPGSVLWLFASSPSVIERLRAEARQRGLQAERLVFASKIPQPEHLARLPLADLVLDTRPYNAHTTASDALRMGVPILTCPGVTFASRVAASLLRAAGLPELSVPTLDDYETLALHLATHPTELEALRLRLRAARNQASYFQPEIFADHLEALYQRMWSRHIVGLPPAMLPPVPRASPAHMKTPHPICVR